MSMLASAIAHGLDCRSTTFRSNALPSRGQRSTKLRAMLNEVKCKNYLDYLTFIRILLFEQIIQITAENQEVRQ